MPAADDKYFLILGSLALQAGPFTVRLRIAPSDQPPSLPLETYTTQPERRRQIRRLQHRLARARKQTRHEAAFPVSPRPPLLRDFYIFNRERDFYNPDHYVKVTGVLQAVGRHCQVYVDRAYPDAAGLRPTVDDVVRTFDREVFPRARRKLGHALDVDRDGRFTVLFTPWLGKMSNGKVSIEGFVRGSDFYRDLGAPFSNRCDVMYLNTDLKPGPYLRTLLAHEYTHAVVFTEHVLTGYLPEILRRDEEAWLNEGLAHLAEDLNGYSWGNLDYRISAFLNAPQGYALVVPDYYGAGLWRSHGNRGATYLFLRWCAEQYGPDLAARLIQTNLSGVNNLEVATGKDFPELFRGWSEALLSFSREPRASATARARTRLAAKQHCSGLQPLDLRHPLGGRLLCGPRFAEVSLGGAVQEVKLAGTSAAYCLLHSPAGKNTRLSVSAPTTAGLQVSLLRLPPHSARLRLRWEPAETAGCVRLVLNAHDADVTLQGAAWECLVPAANRPEDTSYHPGTKPGQTVRAWFGNPLLKKGETRKSVDIPLPSWRGPNNPLLFKVAAATSTGQPCSAWVNVLPERK
jgi:hypothetical protein